MKVVNTFQEKGCGENGVASRDREYNRSPSAHIHAHIFMYFFLRGAHLVQ